MQLSSEDEKEEKREKKKVDILRMVKKIINGFMIRGSGMSI